MSIVKALVDYLRAHKEDICDDKEVLVEDYSPTYGYSDPRVNTIEVVNFDKLCAAIEEFSKSFSSQDEVL